MFFFNLRVTTQENRFLLLFLFSSTRSSTAVGWWRLASVWPLCTTLYRNDFGVANAPPTPLSLAVSEFTIIIPIHSCATARMQKCVLRGCRLWVYIFGCRWKDEATNGWLWFGYIYIYIVKDMNIYMGGIIVDWVVVQWLRMEENLR